MAVLQRLGHYRVTASLGEGGMGLVYAAVDERLERPVALKILHAATANNEVARERFRREARLAASVNHPHVCQLYEIGETDGQLFIVMELLDGESLAARIYCAATVGNLRLDRERRLVGRVGIEPTTL